MAACDQLGLGTAHEYTLSQFKFKLIFHFYSELLFISLAGIWTQDFASGKQPCWPLSCDDLIQVKNTILASHSSAKPPLVGQNIQYWCLKQNKSWKFFFVEFFSLLSPLTLYLLTFLLSFIVLSIFILSFIVLSFFFLFFPLFYIISRLISSSRSLFLSIIMYLFFCVPFILCISLQLFFFVLLYVFL